MRISPSTPPHARRDLVRCALLGGIVCAALLPSVALADGRGEIDQVCATTTGCFAGDAPGFPVTITGAGARSVVLTSDLVLPDASADGIIVSATDVTIDLAGHSIQLAACAGATAACADPLSSTCAIATSIGPDLYGMVVRNGELVGMACGILGDVATEVSGVVARWNRAFGISSSRWGSILLENTAFENGGSGFIVQGQSLVLANQAIANGFAGILDASSPGHVVHGNTALSNASFGISAPDGSVVVGNVSRGNETRGLFGDAVNVVQGNTVVSNTPAASGAVGGFGSIVQGNTVRDNGGFGIVLDPTAGYRENVVSINAGGTVLSGVDLGDNACDGTTTCP